VALIADLLSLPASERHKLPNLSPQRKKEKTLEALIRQLEGLARQQPIAMVFEDAHWIDRTSRELLDLTIDRVRSLPVLLIVTFRPEFQPPWTGQPQVTMLALNRLDRHDRTALVEQVAGGKSLPGEVIDQIADRTDGVPLFIEELTKSILESGVPAVGIPTTLHDSLMARLDRLSSGRRVAQIGAAIGREFSYQLLRAVSHFAEVELQTALARLVASELVFQRGVPPDAVYSFKHALVQDVAHTTLLRSSRQQLHAQIAQALEADSPELMESQPELFARHYAEAGLVEKSVAFWGKAGRRSAARSAMAEAVAQFQKGLNQLGLLQDSRERQRQELEPGATPCSAGRGASPDASGERRRRIRADDDPGNWRPPVARGQRQPRREFYPLDHGLDAEKPGRRWDRDKVGNAAIGFLLVFCRGGGEPARWCSLRRPSPRSPSPSRSVSPAARSCFSA
jgi:predicted ATPase